MLKIEAATSSYRAVAQNTSRCLYTRICEEIRWMLEELRVSYYAQQLGTPYPISDKRIQMAIDAC